MIIKFEKTNFGVYFAMISRSVIFGLSIYFTGNLLESVDAFEVLALRFLLSALVFSFLVLFKVFKVNYRGKRLLPLICVMIFEPIGYFIFEVFGILGTTTSVAGLLNSLIPAFVIIFEILILNESTTRGQKILIILRVLSGLLIVLNAGSGQDNTPMGVLFMLLSVFSGVFYYIFSRKASKEFTAIEVTYAMTIVGAFVFNGINIVRHLQKNTITSYFDPYFDVDNLIGFVFLSVFCSVLATFFNNYALGKVKASIVSALGGLSTVVTVIAGALFNQEQMYWYHYVSVSLIVISCFAVMYIEEKKNKEEMSYGK